MTVGGDCSISSAFPFTPFKDTTHSFQEFMPMSAKEILKPLPFLGAQGKFLNTIYNKYGSLKLDLELKMMFILNSLGGYFETLV